MTASETLHLTGTDVNGAWVSADVTITRSLTLFGSDAKVVDLKRLPGMAFTRRFSHTNVMPDLHDVPAGVEVCASTAQLPDAQAQAQWFTDHRYQTGWITVKHEVNTGKKGTPAQFKADLLALKAMRDAHPNGGNWDIIEIFTAYPQEHGGADWLTWTTGQEDAQGWDVYLSSKALYYPTPPTFFASAVNAAKRSGKPLLITEFGCLSPMPFDPTGAGAADWLTACADYLRSIGVMACAVWDNPQGDPDNTGSAKQTYVLSGPALAAWQAVCS